MFIKINKNTDNYLEFLVSGVDLSFINALRRIIISEVETWAIEYVVFENNTTVIHDEMLAHRIGLIPIKYIGNEDKEETYLIFNKTAADDFNVEEWYSNDIISETNDIEIPIKNIPIIKTVKNQQLKFRAKAIKGKGEQHSKWSPVSDCYFEKVNEGFIFKLESIGSLNSYEIVEKSINILKNKLQNVKDNLY